MSDPVDPTRTPPVPYVLAQLLGEHLVRLEKLERRVAHHGETIKRLVTDNGALHKKLSTLQRSSPTRTPASLPRLRAEPAVETPRPAESAPDFTGSLRELRGVSRQAN